MNEARDRNPEEWSPAVRAVLDGDGSYDSLSVSEQVVVRAQWEHRIAQHRAALNFEADFIAEGGTWVVGDSDGNVIYKNVDEQGRVIELTREEWERLDG